METFGVCFSWNGASFPCWNLSEQTKWVDDDAFLCKSDSLLTLILVHTLTLSTGDSRHTYMKGQNACCCTYCHLLPLSHYDPQCTADGACAPFDPSIFRLCSCEGHVTSPIWPIYFRLCSCEGHVTCPIWPIHFSALFMWRSRDMS